MIIPKPVLLLAALLLLSICSHGQARTGSEPSGGTTSQPVQQQLTVQVTLPTVVGVLGSYAQSLLARNSDPEKPQPSKRKSRTSNPVVEFTIDLPKGWGSKKRE